MTPQTLLCFGVEGIVDDNRNSPEALLSEHIMNKYQNIGSWSKDYLLLLLLLLSLRSKFWQTKYIHFS